MEYTLESMFGIEDRVIVITGGSGGIGKGLAKALASLKAKVALIARNEEKVKQAATELQAECHSEVRGYAANVPDEESVRAAFEQIYADFGSIYGLVNCAGISNVQFLSEMPIEKWQEVMDVNLRGSVVCAKVAGDYMKKEGCGRIINISSLGARRGKPGYTAYTPSKAAIEAFTFTLAAEWGRKNINVNAIAPMFVLTDINKKQWEGKGDINSLIAQGVPKGTVCSPELLSGLCVFLLSEASSYITGQNIGCDGGTANGDIILMKPE